MTQLIVLVNGVEQDLTTHYTLDATNGVVDFVSAPVANSALVFTYYSQYWTDAQVEDFLLRYGNNVNITAAQMLIVRAAELALSAKRETKSGGGGLGAHTIDTSVAVKELRATAAALMDWEREYGDTTGVAIPAEGLTEIPWTEAAHGEIANQRWVREN